MEIIRKSNFEALRLLCIYGITVMHVFGNIDTGASAINTELHVMMNALFNTGVTCFILISGYFGIRFRLQKLIEMDLMVVFYTVVATVLQGNLSAKVFLQACIPIVSRRYWFISCYFALCFLAPLLNEIPKQTEKNTFERLLGIMLLLFSIIPTITTYDLMQDAGKGLVHFVMIYLMGRYLALYQNKAHDKRRLCIGFVLCILLIFALDSIRTRFHGTLYSTFARDCSVFIIAASVCLFLLFKELQISSRLVNRMASNVLAVTVLDVYIQKFLSQYFALGKYGGHIALGLFVLLYAALVVGIAMIIDEIRKATVGGVGHRLSAILVDKCYKVQPGLMILTRRIVGWFVKNI